MTPNTPGPHPVDDTPTPAVEERRRALAEATHNAWLRDLTREQFAPAPKEWHPTADEKRAGRERMDYDPARALRLVADNDSREAG